MEAERNRNYFQKRLDICCGKEYNGKAVAERGAQVSLERAAQHLENRIVRPRTVTVLRDIVTRAERLLEKGAE